MTRDLDCDRLHAPFAKAIALAETNSGEFPASNAAAALAVTPINLCDTSAAPHSRTKTAVSTADSVNPRRVSRRASAVRPLFKLRRRVLLLQPSERAASSWVCPSR